MDPVAGFPAYVGVTSLEFELRLSRSSVRAGDVIVELRNRGEDPHDLQLVREGLAEPALEIPETRPGRVSSAQFWLGAGTWRLFCSLPGHEELGMRASLTVR